jgi:iron complex outermembrane receptor protein
MLGSSNVPVWLFLWLVLICPVRAQEADSVRVIALSGVTVSASYARSLSRSSAVPIDVAGEAFLREHPAGNLVQALEHMPGVQSIDIGAGFSKPVIRGMSLNRVSVVDNGIKQEGQQWGADHPLETDVFNVERVTVRKGPSSLLYGSDAIGGVIELSHAPAPQERLSGEAVLSAKSVNDLVGGSFMLGLRTGNWYVKGRISAQFFGDYRIPADTVVYLTQRMPVAGRRLKNTAGKELAASLSASYRKDAYAAAYLLTTVRQAVGFFPGAHGIPDLARLADDGDSRNVGLPCSNVTHLRASSHQARIFGENTSVTWDAGLQWNRRQEYSAFHTHYGTQSPPAVDPDKELDFGLATLSSAVRFRFGRSLRWQHVAGWDLQYQDNAVSGYSFLLPDFRRLTSGLLWLTDFRPSERLTVSGGLRYDVGRLQTESFADPYLPAYLASRGFSEDDIQSFRFRSYPVLHRSGNFSGSVGLVAQLSDEHFVKFNIGSSYRLPTPNELASNGVHHGAFRHEQGDPSLRPESGRQIDFSYSFERENVFVLTVSPFAALFSNYIYLLPTGEWSPLPHAGQIYRYAGARAFFSGAELSLHFPTLPAGFGYGLDGEYVYSLNCDERIPIAFSPPASLRQTLRWEAAPFVLLLQWQSVAAQRRIARNEDPTPGAQLFHATLVLTLPSATLTLAARNLTDKRFFNHVSFYRKVEIPEPGRNVQLLISIPIKIKNK